MTNWPDDPISEDEPEPVGEDPATGDPPQSIIDRLRGTGVGVEDPNIIGDAGPTDVAPGADPPLPPLDEPLPPEVPFE